MGYNRVFYKFRNDCRIFSRPFLDSVWKVYNYKIKTIGNSCFVVIYK